MKLQDHSFSGPSLVQTLRQDVPSQMAGLVTWNKINISVVSDTSVSKSIFFLVLVDLINCNSQGNMLEGSKVKSEH